MRHVKKALKDVGITHPEHVKHIIKAFHTEHGGNYSRPTANENRRYDLRKSAQPRRRAQRPRGPARHIYD